MAPVDSFPPAVPGRRLVFVSHANPEDNDFVAWLGARLSVLGYDVWSDLLKLVGGEVIWQDIREAVESHVAAFIVVMSQSSCAKPGVIQEIGIAEAVAEKCRMDHFIVPVKLDDLPYDRFPGGISRITAVDFSQNWGVGFSRLRNALQKLGVPTSTEERHVDCWRNLRLSEVKPLGKAPEELSSNWFAIASMPTHVNLLEVRNTSISTAKLEQQLRTPIGRHRDVLVFFASVSSNVTPDVQVPLEEFVSSGHSASPIIPQHDAWRIMVRIINRSWEKFARARRLRKRKDVWFFPAQSKEGVIVKFPGGKWRKLTGWSESRKRFWHYGISPRIILSEPKRMVVQAHVIFTKDGHTPIKSDESAIRLRRGYCKNWWNPRWRDLAHGFVRVLAKGHDILKIPLGRPGDVLICSGPMLFHAGFSISGDDSDDTDAHDIDPDLLDDGSDPGPDDGDYPESKPEE